MLRGNIVRARLRWWVASYAMSCHIMGCTGDFWTDSNLRDNQDLVILHNNWIKGMKNKIQRLVDQGMRYRCSCTDGACPLHFFLVDGTVWQKVYARASQAVGERDRSDRHNLRSTDLRQAQSVVAGSCLVAYLLPTGD